jgi:hypothetical protein
MDADQDLPGAGLRIRVLLYYDPAVSDGRGTHLGGRSY